MDEDVTLVGMSPSEAPGSPLRLDASFRGDDGAEILSIVKNELRTAVSHFDVTTVGDRVEIRRKAHEIVLAMEALSDREVCIERLHMRHKGCEIICNEGSLTLKGPRGATLNLAGSRAGPAEVTVQIGIWFKSGRLVVATNHSGDGGVTLE